MLSQTIHRGSGRYHISLIIIFISLTTLGYLYKRVLLAVNWLEGFGGKGMLTELVLKLHLHSFVSVFVFSHWKFVGMAFKWLKWEGTMSKAPPHLSTISSHAQISTVNLKIKIKTFITLKLSYHS